MGLYFLWRIKGDNKLKDKAKQKHHFHVYNVNPNTRNKFLVLCKIMGKSGSRVIEEQMEKFIARNAKKLND